LVSWIDCRQMEQGDLNRRSQRRGHRERNSLLPLLPPVEALVFIAGRKIEAEIFPCIFLPPSFCLPVHGALVPGDPALEDTIPCGRKAGASSAHSKRFASSHLRTQVDTLNTTAALRRPRRVERRNVSRSSLVLRPSFRPLDAAGDIAARCPYLIWVERPTGQEGSAGTTFLPVSHTHVNATLIRLERWVGRSLELRKGAKPPPFAPVRRRAN
jgi:hypothetical protein